MQNRSVFCDGVASKRDIEALYCDAAAIQSDSPAFPLERRSLLEELAGKGVRMTAQRRILVEIIQSARQHLDAASLLKLAREKEASIDRATVYRTIELLKRLRLIDELDLMHLQGEKHYYEVRTRRDHIHLACFQCGGIEEISSHLFERLKSEIAGRAGFELRVTRFEVGGRCRSCSGEAGKVQEREEVALAASNQ